MRRSLPDVGVGPAGQQGRHRRLAPLDAGRPESERPAAHRRTLTPMPTAPPKPPTGEIGHVAHAGAVAGPGGTMLAGTMLDPAEETAAWQWPQSIRTADTLIKNSQVQAVMWAVTLPIRRPSIWALDPRRASEEVTRFVAEDLDLPILGDDQPKTPP